MLHARHRLPILVLFLVVAVGLLATSAAWHVHSGLAERDGTGSSSDCALCLHVGTPFAVATTTALVAPGNASERLPAYVLDERPIGTVRRESAPRGPPAFTPSRSPLEV